MKINFNLKFLLILSFFCLGLQCSSSNKNINSNPLVSAKSREPSSLLEKNGVKIVGDSAKERINRLLKFILISEKNFSAVSRGDCKAFVSQNDSYCTSKNCLAILKNQSALCESNDCKALTEGNPIFCESKNCSAIIKDSMSECDSNNMDCLSLFNSAYCTSPDCESYIKEFAGRCQNFFCHAISKENIMECDK